MYSLRKAELNHDYSLPIEDMIARIEKTTIENKADEIINNRFADLALFINESGQADEYDKHFENMLKGRDKAVSNAYNFLYEEAKKMAKEKLDTIK